MPCISINGKRVEAREGASLLECACSTGVDIPSLCADPRLKAYGGCRMCLVQIEGEQHPVTACTTVVREGMAVRTHTPEIEQHRKTLLRLLAEKYPGKPLYDAPAKAFHKYLARYGVACNGANDNNIDRSHPYIQVDMSRCILCERCVRICEEVQGSFVWQAWNRGEATVIRAGLVDGLLQSPCTSCGACVDTCPTGALEDKSLIGVASALNWTRTICPYCGVGCEIKVGTHEGKLVNVRPGLDAAVNKGHLCSKGRYAFGYVHSDERVLHPMIRKHGDWQVVSWEEAIAETARVLRKAIDARGPDSVGILGSARGTNEEAYLAQKFARVVAGANNVDCCARVCHAPSAAALKQMIGTGAATNSFDDIEQAASVLVWGCNPTDNHPVAGARIKQAALRGAPLIVVDPRETELCKFAQVHLQIRPGTDIPALLAMAGVIVQENLFDPEFANHRIGNLEAFKQFIGKWTPEHVSVICCVSPDTIRRAARIYAQNKPAICFHGLGLTEHVQGTEAVMCLINLALLTGNLGKAGCGINPLRGQNNVQGAAVMGCDPGALTGSISLQEGIARFETAWNLNLPKGKGLDAMQMLAPKRKERLRVLWAIGYDILLTNPDMSSTRKALKKMDAVIVQDMFLNQTAREFGTIFLPACSSFEKDGTFMNAERRIQRVRAALPPIGESRPDWEIICSIAHAMSKGKYFSYTTPQTVWDEIRTMWPAVAGISYQRLEGGGIQWPCSDETHPGTTMLHQSEFASGRKAVLHCPEFQPSPETASPEFSFLLLTGRTLQHFNAGTMTGHTGHRRLQHTGLLDICPEDAAQLELQDGDFASIRSHYGELRLPVHITSSVQRGQVFAALHDPDRQLNLLTSRLADRQTNTPEYKLTAVHIEKVLP